MRVSSVRFSGLELDEKGSVRLTADDSGAIAIRMYSDKSDNSLSIRLRLHDDVQLALEREVKSLSQGLKTPLQKRQKIDEASLKERLHAIVERVRLSGAAHGTASLSPATVANMFSGIRGGLLKTLRTGILQVWDSSIEFKPKDSKKPAAERKIMA